MPVTTCAGQRRVDEKFGRALSVIPVSRVGSVRNTLKILQSEGLQIVAANKEQHAAVRGRPDQADRAGNGQRGRRHLKRCSR
ncbi:MAG: hypothetical protein ACLUEV_05140 [Alistipes sp.]